MPLSANAIRTCHPVPRRGVARGDRDDARADLDRSAVRHRVPRVGGQVEEDALDLARGEADLGEVAVGDEADLDARADGPLEQLHRSDDRRAGGARSRGVLGPLDPPLAREQLAAQLGAPLGGVPDLLGALAMAAVVGSVDDLAGADHDHREQVVEVVGDARRPSAEILELRSASGSGPAGALPARGGRSGPSRRTPGPARRRRPGSIRRTADRACGDPSCARRSCRGRLPPRPLRRGRPRPLSVRPGATERSVVTTAGSRRRLVVREERQDRRIVSRRAAQQRPRSGRPESHAPAAPEPTADQRVDRERRIGEVDPGVVDAGVLIRLARGVAELTRDVARERAGAGRHLVGELRIAVRERRCRPRSPGARPRWSCSSSSRRSRSPSTHRARRAGKGRRRRPRRRAPAA